jgi:hypothetical protein
MKVKVSINYNPAKLVKALPKMIENLMEDSGKSSIKASKKRIDTVNYVKHDQSHPKMPKLSDRTLALRKANKLGKKSYGSPRFGETPLKYTGNFYNSMKSTNKGVEMLKYGWYHNIGKSTDGILRPEREFFEFKPSEKGIKKFNQDLQKNLRK